MKKLYLLPLLILMLLCLCGTALAASISGQQSISYITDESGYVTTLTDDDAATVWSKSSGYGVDLTLNLYSASVGEIWIRNGYAYTQNWYNHYDRPDTILVTVYYQANRYTESYDSYRYRLTDAYRPNTVAKGWNSGYQRLLLPKQYTGVTKIELTIESVISGYDGGGATISDIIVAAGSHATATPRSYATSTPKPYVVYVTSTPGPDVVDDDDYPYVEYLTPIPDDDWYDDDPYVELLTPQPTKTPAITIITPNPTATEPLVELLTPEPTATPTPKPVNYPSSGGAIGYANQRIPTRSGPGTGYDEPGSFFSAGHEVKVTSKVWDDNNHLYWYQIEFEYSGDWYRVYTTDSRIDVDASNVPTEPQVGDPLDTRNTIAESSIYYGPGTRYARVRNTTMAVGKRCDIYVIQDGWALVDYYDYGRDVKRRGWVPIDILYGD